MSKAGQTSTPVHWRLARRTVAEVIANGLATAGPAKGGTVTLYIDGKAVGKGRLEQTAPIIFSADETSDVGVKHGSPMTPTMPPNKSAFNGTVDVVVIETSGENTDHLPNREEVLNMIMARQ
jgi:arylsulfatase